MPLMVTVQRTNGSGVTWVMGPVPPGIPSFPIQFGDRKEGQPTTPPTIELIQIDVWVVWKTTNLTLGTGSNLGGNPAVPTNGPAGGPYPQDSSKTGTCWLIDYFAGDSPALTVIVDCLGTGSKQVEVLVVGRDVRPPRLPPGNPADFDYHTGTLIC